MPIQLDASTFDETIAANHAVLVDFWADWCGPCRSMEPVLEQLAAQRQDQLIVAKVNVDEQPDLARRFGVMSLPTLVVFADGEPRGHLTGARGAAQLADEVDRFLDT